MSNQISKLLTGALITGLLSGSVALAQETTAVEVPKPAATGEKNSCTSKDGCAGKDKKSCAKEDKNCCKSVKKDKNSCSGANGCGEKQMKKEVPTAPAKP